MAIHATLSANTHYIDAGSEATIDDLPTSDFTFEGWFKVTPSNIPVFANKTWFQLTADSSGDIVSFVGLDVTVHTETYGGGLVAGKWYHIAFTWDISAFTGVVFVDGVLINSVTEGAGAYFGDASNTLYIGNQDNDDANRVDAVGWVRISDNIRYTAAFTPNDRSVPPANDANTVRLFRVNEGSGTAITDYSSNAQNATLSGGWAGLDTHTNLGFLTALQAVSVTGVNRTYSEPPASIKTADLPAAFPLMPGGDLGGIVVSCLTQNKSRAIQYVIAVEAAGQGTQAQNYDALALLMDALESELDDLLQSQGGTLSDFLNYTITTGTLQEVAGNQYWAIIADITASGRPL